MISPLTIATNGYLSNGINPLLVAVDGYLSWSAEELLPGGGSNVFEQDITGGSARQWKYEEEEAEIIMVCNAFLICH